MARKERHACATAGADVLSRVVSAIGMEACLLISLPQVSAMQKRD